MANLPPTAFAPVALPTTSIVRTLIWGQSNGVGQGTRVDPVSFALPWYCRHLDEHLGRKGIFEPLGAAIDDQAVPPSLTGALGASIIKRGPAPGIAAALVGGGKNPIMATIARSGTAISYWGSGQPGETAFDAYAGELVAACGSANWHIVTLHGESDAQAPGTAAAYQANFAAWSAHMRGKFPSARVYAVQVNTNLVGSDTATVRTAISNVVSGDSNAELISGDAFGYASPHYTDTGIDSLAAAIGARVLANA